MVTLVAMYSQLRDSLRLISPSTHKNIPSSEQTHAPTSLSMSSCTHSDEGPSPETETVFPRHKNCCSSSRRRFLHSLLYHVVIESDQVPSPFYSIALHNLIPTPSRLPPPRHISLLGKPHQHHTHSSCHWVHILGMYKLLSGQINTTHPPLLP